MRVVFCLGAFVACVCIFITLNAFGVCIYERRSLSNDEIYEIVLQKHFSGDAFSKSASGEKGPVHPRDSGSQILKDMPNCCSIFNEYRTDLIEMPYLFEKLFGFANVAVEVNLPPDYADPPVRRHMIVVLNNCGKIVR